MSDGMSHAEREAAIRRLIEDGSWDEAEDLDRPHLVHLLQRRSAELARRDGDTTVSHQAAIINDAVLHFQFPPIAVGVGEGELARLSVDFTPLGIPFRDRLSHDVSALQSVSDIVLRLYGYDRILLHDGVRKHEFNEKAWARAIGTIFEDYCAVLLDHPANDLRITARSPEPGVYVAPHSPDASRDFEIRDLTTGDRFSVECKYTTKGAAVWVEDWQIRKYIEHARETGLAGCYVLAGRGGFPFLPNELYRIDLREYEAVVDSGATFPKAFQELGKWQRDPSLPLLLAGELGEPAVLS